MNETTPGPRTCRICGDPIRRNNKYGVCSDLTKPACEKARRLAREGRTEEEQKACEICGQPLRLDNKTGICSDRGTSECRRVRRRMNRGAEDPRAQRHLLTIHPGDTFGLWTALEEYSTNSKTVLCCCECGTERAVRASNLVRGESGSCRCGPHKRRKPFLAAGTTFGRLTVIEDVASGHDRGRFRCACGSGEKVILACSVKYGLTKSCGCLTRTLGGFSKHPLYSTWASMIQRCTNPNHAGYHLYRRLPVPVCDRWRDPWAFAEDILREIGSRPEGRDGKGRVLYELDRANNELGYGPGNVRWLDKKGQRANQRTIEGLTGERDAALVRVAELEALLLK